MGRRWRRKKRWRGRREMVGVVELNEAGGKKLSGRAKEKGKKGSGREGEGELALPLGFGFTCMYGYFILDPK